MDRKHTSARMAALVRSARPEVAPETHLADLSRATHREARKLGGAPLTEFALAVSNRT